MQIWKKNIRRAHILLVTSPHSMVFSRSKDKIYFPGQFQTVKIERIFPRIFVFKVFEFIIYDSEIVASGNMFLPQSTKMDRTISSLSKPSPLNSISTPSSVLPAIFKQQSSRQDWGFFVSSQWQNLILKKLHSRKKVQKIREISFHKTNLQKGAI